MSIYTRTGDAGETGLISGVRVAKNDQRVEALGTCDEANAAIGVAISHIDQGLTWSLSERKKFLVCMERIQKSLFHIGAELASPGEGMSTCSVTETHVLDIEKDIDKWEEELPELTKFILPSGHPTAASLHLARTIVRRAERVVVGMKDEVTESILPCLNRLSDLLFVAARYVNQFCSHQEKTFEANE